MPPTSSPDAPQTADKHPRKLSECWKVLTAALAVLQIIFVYVIPGYVLFGLVFLLFFALILGLSAGWGAAFMVVGNIVLSSAHMSGYTTSDHAAAIGATGGCISGLIMSCLSAGMHCGRSEEDDPWYIRLLSTILFSTLAGVIGCAILLQSHVDIGGIDIEHSAGAGALGGLILSIAVILVWPLLMAAIFIILSPLFLAMSMVLKWVHIRSNGSWEQRGHWSHYEEFDAEMAPF